MNWDSLQQLLRIVLYAIGGYLFGEGTAEGAQYQQAVGGLLTVLTFVWWWFWERKRT